MLQSGSPTVPNGFRIVSEVAVVTSFSPNGYDLYGKKFIESFDAHWHPDIPLYCYTEGMNLGNQGRLVFRDLFDASQDCDDFVIRHVNNDVAKGKKAKPGLEKRFNLKPAPNFKYDAYKFCRKVFAIQHAANNVHCRLLIWCDADMLFTQEVPIDLLQWALPADAVVSYLGRPGYYSECGFVCYRLPEAKDMINEFARLYASDEVFELEEWHDSWVFDYVREKMNVPGFDMGGFRSGKVLALSKLGQYMIHLKGNLKHEGNTRLRFS